jgi:cyclophilin family peptidyl-prolyl cis-trans isomerase
LVSCAKTNSTKYYSTKQDTGVTTDMSANTTAGKGKTLEKPGMIIDTDLEYTAIMKTTAGDMKIKLYPENTPITTNNFVYLAREGFYNGTIFHRVIKGFMIQGGDPEGTGMGGPGYKFDDEPFTGTYTKGTLAMANAGPNTNGSQFFIMHADYPLPKNYIIFGEVIEGLEVVDKIAEAPTEFSSSGEMSKPVKPVTIESVIIEESK